MFSLWLNGINKVAPNSFLKVFVVVVVVNLTECPCE